MYLSVVLIICVCICKYLITLCLQNGLMPLTTADYPHYPFTSGADKKGWAGSVSLRVESFHNAVGSLRCFDATKTSPDKKPHFNWFDRDNCFIAGVRRAPPYTDLFWVLFFQVAANLGDASKEIMEANSPAEIDALRLKKIKVVVHDGTDFITQEIKLISDEIRSMVDNICYMAVYGHKSMFEKLSPARRTAFKEYSLKIAREYEDEFYASWKSYRAAHPVETVKLEQDDSDCEKMMNTLLGDDDAGPGAAGPAPPAAAAAAAADAASD